MEGGKGRKETGPKGEGGEEKEDCLSLFLRSHVDVVFIKKHLCEMRIRKCGTLMKNR